MKRVFLLGMSLGLLSLGVSTRVGAVAYHMRDLGVPPGFLWSEATAINNAGVVAGNGYYLGEVMDLDFDGFALASPSG